MQTVSFLVGAGVSQAAGLPGVADITKRVLTGDEVYCHSNQVFYFGKPMFAHMGWPDEKVPRIVELLAILWDDLKSFHKRFNFADPTYEDLYYVCRRLESYSAGFVPDVTIDAFCRSVESRATHLLSPRLGDIDSEKRLVEIYGDACDYIADIAWHMLEVNKRMSPITTILADCHKSDNIDIKLIATTNYETLLEDGLIASEITYSDGFTGDESGPAFYDPETLISNSNGLMFLKLHGSLNWYQLMTNDDGPRHYYIVKTPFDPYNSKSPDGRSLTDVFDRPALIVGTHNKYEAYIREIYAHMSCLLWNQLRQTDILVVAGFGFGDQGINDRIIDWLNWANPKRLVVVDPFFSKTSQTFKPGLRYLLMSAGRSDLLRVLESRIEDITWKDIEQIL